MSTPEAMTAIPGVTVKQAQALAEGPDAAEVTSLIGDFAELYELVRNGGSSTPRASLLGERIDTMLDRLKTVSLTGRLVGARLAEMSDTEKAMVAADEMGRVAEMACGYRARLETGGFSDAMAQHMAAQFHTMLLTQATKS